MLTPDEEAALIARLRRRDAERLRIGSALGIIAFVCAVLALVHYLL
jgi:hypothetical protein